MEQNHKSQVKSKKRVSDHGEVFTSEREVNAMLDLVKQETERIDSRFLEPACGTGNFLAAILERKLNVVESRHKNSRLDFERHAVIAVASIYGVDILEDNVSECRERLFNLLEQRYSRIFIYHDATDFLHTVRFILSRNMLWGDALTLKTPGANPQPIIFSEWSAVDGSHFKRRDYTMANLLESQPMDGRHLFSDLGDQAFLPKPVREFPLAHYLKLADDR